jgi:hypothetical protein
MVQDDKHNIAAITVYMNNEDMTVYYTKNELGEKDIEHVEKIARRVRAFKNSQTPISLRSQHTPTSSATHS